MLGQKKIAEEVAAGNIVIDPYDPERLNSNSYNLQLGPKLLVYKRHRLSTRKPPIIETEINMTKEGCVLRPGFGYIGETVERMYCRGIVPALDGRSSTGRLFLLVHCTAGLGDDGWRGRWTLEIVPLFCEVEVFPGDELLQVRFHRVEGESVPYDGVYQNQEGATPSLLPWSNRERRAAKRGTQP